MLVITGGIMNLSVCVFAIYGIYVLVKWRKAADKVDKMLDETSEELRPKEEGGSDNV